MGIKIERTDKLLGKRAASRKIADLRYTIERLREELAASAARIRALDTLLDERDVELARRVREEVAE